jgi:hypothetical protein
MAWKSRVLHDLVTKPVEKDYSSYFTGKDVYDDLSNLCAMNNDNIVFHLKNWLLTINLDLLMVP